MNDTADVRPTEQPGGAVRPWWYGTSWSLAAGVAWVLALPPVGWWPLAFVAVAGLALAVEGQPLRRRALHGFTTGMVVFASTLRWATLFTFVGFATLAVLQSAFVAAAAAAAPANRHGAVSLAGGLVVVEWVRHRWPLTGLPLSGLDLTQTDGPLLGLVSAVGPYGLVLAVGTVAGTVVVLSHRRVSWAVLAVVLGAATVVVAGLVAPASIVDTRTATVAVVQGGGTRGVPAVVSTDDAVFARHLAANTQVPADTELVLWPEDVVDVAGPFDGSDEADVLAGLAVDRRTTMVVGVVSDVGVQDGQVRRFRNQAVVFAPDGRRIDTYDKVVRVPFGEYVPLRDVVRRFVDLSLVPRDAVPGTAPPVLDTPVGRIGVSVSFEGLFASRSRDAVRRGAALLVNPTNASSYVTADVPAQQVAAARLRAVETGRAVLMAAPTGYSAIVAPDGTVLDRSDLETPATLVGTVPFRRGLTTYAATGDLPSLAAAVLLLVLGWTRAILRARPVR